MTAENDLLDQYARVGKVHPRIVLRQVVRTSGGAVGSVDALIAKNYSNDLAVTVARAFGIYLLSDDDMAGLGDGQIARIFSCAHGTVRVLRDRIEAKRASDENFRAWADQIISAISQDQRELPTMPDPETYPELRRPSHGIGNVPHAAELSEPSDDHEFASMSTRIGGSKVSVRIRVIAQKVQIMRLLTRHRSMSPGQIVAELKIAAPTLSRYMAELLEDYPEQLAVSGKCAKRRYVFQVRERPEKSEKSVRTTKLARERPINPGVSTADSRRPDLAYGKRRRNRTAHVLAPRMDSTAGSMPEFAQALALGSDGSREQLAALTPAGWQKLIRFFTAAAMQAIHDGVELLEQSGPVNPDKLEQAHTGVLAMHVLLEGAINFRGSGDSGVKASPGKRARRTSSK